MVDLYNNAQRYEQAKQGLDNWDIHDENKQIIKDYLAEQIDQLSPGARYAAFCFLKRTFYGKTQGSTDDKPSTEPFVNQPLRTMTLEEWRDVDERIRKEEFSKDTYSKITNHLRRIYEQEFEDTEDPEQMKILNAFSKTGRRAFFKYQTNKQVNRSLHKEKFYTYEEFTKLLRVARRPQERALLALAWESTSRPNEYLSLKVGDVEPMKNGFTIKAHISKKKGGETETRNLYIITFRAEFADFYNRHAKKDDPEAPLFYREDNAKNFGEPLGPAGANKMLKQLDYRSGVKKNGTLYYLRHGGYTWKKAQGMNEALAGKDMGWVPGSKQARRYEHLQDEDLLSERLRLADERYEKEVKPKIKVRVCPFCNQENSPVDEMCSSCGQTLDMSKIVRDLERAKADQERSIQYAVEQVLRKMKDGKKGTS